MLTVIEDDNNGAVHYSQVTVFTGVSEKWCVSDYESLHRVKTHSNEKLAFDCSSAIV